MEKRIIYQIFAGMLGALILGLLLGFNLLIYGANHGCFSFVDSIFAPNKGYISCGYFGFIVGALLGAILGVILYRVDWQNLLKLNKK